MRQFRIFFIDAPSYNNYTKCQKRNKNVLHWTFSIQSTKPGSVVIIWGHFHPTLTNSERVVFTYEIRRPFTVYTARVNGRTSPASFEHLIINCPITAPHYRRDNPFNSPQHHFWCTRQAANYELRQSSIADSNHCNSLTEIQVIFSNMDTYSLYIVFFYFFKFLEKGLGVVVVWINTQPLNMLLTVEQIESLWFLICTCILFLSERKITK